MLRGHPWAFSSCNDDDDDDDDDSTSICIDSFLVSLLFFACFDLVSQIHGDSIMRFIMKKGRMD